MSDAAAEDATEVFKSQSVVRLIDQLQPFLDDPEVSEIFVNRPNEVFTQPDRETRHVIDYSFERMQRMAMAVASRSGTDIKRSMPILSSILPGGQRIQISIPPACEDGTVAVTIRKPSRHIFSLNEFAERGFFDVCGSVDYFASLAKEGKTALFAGATNSGKTTLINAMIGAIPSVERIVTIEDVHELRMHHANVVHLFFQPGGVTATQQLANAMRSNPDRVILGECRGKEALDMINVAASGHQGSMTSCHAKNCDLALKRMAMMAMQNPDCPPYEAIMMLIREVIDVVIHIDRDASGKRYVSEIMELGT